jgi:hypothetical protein
MTSVSWLVTGGTIGVLNGLSLRWTVARLRPDAPRRAVALAMAGTLLRRSLVAGLLIAALRRGVTPGLLAFGGLWLARWGVVCCFNARG